jgi:uncharacterized protein involved in response to NO
MARSLTLSTELPQPRARPRMALAAKGFRPFFLAAAIYAVGIVPAWLLILYGVLPGGAYLDPLVWHAHEMVFGFTTAVIAGFLLTAVGNWTGRETLIGGRLLALAALWLAGRISLMVATRLPHGVPALIDLAFIPTLMLVLAKPLIASGNRRNFVMLAILGALFSANLVVHLDALGVVRTGLGLRACLAAVDVALVIIVVMLGRVLPMFTRNATQVSSIRSHPALDKACAGSMALLALAGAMSFPSEVSRTAAALTAILSVARAWNWGARHTLRIPLLWILHAGHAWLVLGLALRAVPISNPFVSSLALHALTVGAIGSLTLGMMARVALGHSGRMLTSAPVMAWAFAAIQLAAFTRVFVPIVEPAWYRAGLWASGGLWVIAFGVYIVVYAPMLTSPRVDGKPG